VKTVEELAFLQEEKRHLDAAMKLIDRFPAYRAKFLYGLLGGVIALCDSFGIDVEAFIVELRRRKPRPDIFVPGKERTS